VTGSLLGESPSIVSLDPASDGALPGTIGMPVPETDMRVIEHEGRPGLLGQPADLIEGGPQMMRGKLNPPDETGKSIQNSRLQPDVQSGVVRTTRPYPAFICAISSSAVRALISPPSVIRWSASSCAACVEEARQSLTSVT
jgi:hypothetical protein